MLSGETRHPRAPTEDDSEDDNVSEASWFTAPSQSPLSPQVSQLTAPLGMCRELCSLVRENGDRLCTRKCTFDRYVPQPKYMHVVVTPLQPDTTQDTHLRSFYFLSDEMSTMS